MKATKIFLTFLFSSAMVLTGVFSACAETSVLVDDADLFAESEENEIFSELEDAESQTGWTVAVYTNFNDVDEYDMEEYCNDYYDDRGYGSNGVLLTVDMSSRQMYIITKGEAMDYFSDSRVDSTVESVSGELSDEDYLGAVKAFIEDTQSYKSLGINENDENSNKRIYDEETDRYYSDDEYSDLLEKRDNALLYSLKHYGLISLAAGIIAALITAALIRRRYRDNGKENTYDLAANSKVNLEDSRDVFVTKHVAVTRIQDEAHGGGHGSGGGGSSHGGGGSGF